jgi:hypothetical protein
MYIVQLITIFCYLAKAIGVPCSITVYILCRQFRAACILNNASSGVCGVIKSSCHISSSEPAKDTLF